MSGKQDYFRDALEGKKIPILVLDQRWHQLFDVVEKPSRIKRAEEKVNKLLAKQGKVNDDIKELNALKQKLMDNVMQNIQGAETENRNYAMFWDMTADFGRGYARFVADWCDRCVEQIEKSREENK